MRIAIVGHSLASPRQAIFCDAIRTLGHEVLEVYPSRWHQESRQGGFEVENEGSMQFFTFGFDAFRQVHEWNPDLIYSMSEFWQAQSKVSRVWAKRLGTPLAYFFWENLRYPTPEQAGLIKGASLVVCGNSRAREIISEYNPNAIKLVQVGIDTELFKTINTQKTHSLIFVGRRVKEKGIDHIREVEKTWPILWPAGNLTYDQMPALYNQAKLQIVPSLDTPHWHEQWPACIAEGLACEVPCVAFDAGAIRDHYGSCPGVEIVRQGNTKALKKCAGDLLSDDERRIEMGDAGREWVIANMSKEVIAEELIRALMKVM